MFQYTPKMIPKSIILIGCGGTGSRLMPGMAQLVKTMLQKYNPASWIHDLTIYAVDGDIVEPKNLLRQNFVEQDTGQPKAVVLADRYSNAFGVDVIPVPKFLVSEDTYRDLPNNEERDRHITGTTQAFTSPKVGEGPKSFVQLLERAVIIFGVDSATARKDIMKIILSSVSLSNRMNLFIIDAGNEDDFGQVRFFHPVHVSPSSYMTGMTKLKLMGEHPVSLIPMDLNYYYNLGESVQEKSCADLPQTLAINAAMAVFILSVLQNFLQIKPFTFDCIRFSLKGQLHSDQCSVGNWIARQTTDPKAENYFQMSSGPLPPKDPFYRQIKDAVQSSIDKALSMGIQLKPNGEMVLPTIQPASTPAAKSKSETDGGDPPLADFAKGPLRKKVPKSRNQALPASAEAVSVPPPPPPLTPYNPQENLRPMPSPAR